MLIVDDLEKLARLHEDGAISAVEYEAAKDALLASVPEASRSFPRPEGPFAALAIGAILCLAVSVLALILFGATISMAATLGLTVLAGLIVLLYRQATEED